MPESGIFMVGCGWPIWSSHAGLSENQGLEIRLHVSVNRRSPPPESRRLAYQRAKKPWDRPRGRAPTAIVVFSSLVVSGAPGMGGYLKQSVGWVKAG